MKTRPQAKDIPDAAIIAAVQDVQRTRRLLWASRWDVAERFPDMPPKVVSAKLNSMARRGVLAGCESHHDCRGDFEVKEMPG